MADEVVAMQKNVEKAGQAISKLNDFMKENAESTKNLSKSLSKLSGGLTSIKNSGIHQAMSALSDVFTEEAGSVEALGSALAGMNLPQFVSGVSGVTTALSGAVNMAQTFTSALIGGQGIGSALVSTLGMGGTVGLAVAGVSALGIGVYALSQKIMDSRDPVKQMENALEDITAAEETLNASVNIIDLANRYEELRVKLADTSLSAEELANAEAEMNEVRAQLSQATGGAVSSEGSLNSTLDSTVRIQKALAEIEAQRAKQDLYDTLETGADEYRDSVERLKEAQEEAAAAEERMVNSSESLAGGANEAYQNLQDTLAGIKDRFGDGIIDIDDEEQVNALRVELDGLEAQLHQLGMTDVHLDSVEEAASLINALDMQTLIAQSQDATDEFSDLSAEIQRLSEYTATYENNVITLTREGWLTAEDACDLLGISQEALQRKIKNLEFQELSAARATNDLAKEKLEAAEAAKAQADAEEKATQELGRIGVAAGQAQYSSDNLRESYNELKSQLDDLGEAGDEETRRLAEAALANLNLAATNQELAETYPSLVDTAKTYGLTISDVSQWLIDNELTAEEWAGRVTAASGNVMNGFKELDTSLDMSLSEMKSSLENNITAYTDWNTNIDQLMSAAEAIFQETGDRSAIDFVNYMQQMGIGAADQVAAMVEDMGWTMETFPPLMQQATQQGMLSVYNEVENNKASIAESASGVMDAAATTIEETDLSGPTSTAMSMIPSEITAQAPAVQEAATGLAMTAHSAMATVGWADLGSAIGMGISNGFTAQAGTVQSAAGTLADAAVTAWNSHSGKFQQTGSAAANRLRTGLTQQKSSVTAAGQSLADGVTSAWAQSAAQFQSAGTAASAAIAGGISSGSGGITAAAYTAASSAYGAVSGLGWYGLGYNISAGIASGVRGGSGLITSAAKAAASAALRAAKASLDIHSPSRVFRDQVGRQIPGGIALGIEQGTPQAEKAVELSADQLLRATQIALRPSGNLAPAQSITNNTAYYGGSSGDGVLKAEAPVIIHLDGREVGRGTAKFTGQRMAYLGGLS